MTTMTAATAATAAIDAATMMPVRERLGGPPCSENPAAKTSDRSLNPASHR